jgi:hypothetical protein
MRPTAAASPRFCYGLEPWSCCPVPGIAFPAGICIWHPFGSYSALQALEISHKSRRGCPGDRCRQSAPRNRSALLSMRGCSLTRLRTVLDRGWRGLFGSRRQTNLPELAAASNTRNCALRMKFPNAWGWQSSLIPLAPTVTIQPSTYRNPDGGRLSPPKGGPTENHRLSEAGEPSKGPATRTIAIESGGRMSNDGRAAPRAGGKPYGPGI